MCLLRTCETRSLRCGSSQSPRVRFGAVERGRLPRPRPLPVPVVTHPDSTTVSHPETGQSGGTKTPNEAERLSCRYG